LTDLPARRDGVPEQLRAFEKDGVIASDTGLTFTNPDLAIERYFELAEWLGEYGVAIDRLGTHHLFMVGDLLNAGPKLYGEEWAQVEDVLSRKNMAKQRQMNVQSICNRVPKSVRREGVSFEHHAEVASLKPNDQRRWLKVAETEGLSKTALREQISAERRGHPDVLDPEEPELCPTCQRPLP
jgi:hypothetical protein